MDDFPLRIVAMLPRLRGYARALTRADAAADDLVQATCEKALRAADSFEPGTNLDAWVFRIMRNHWIDDRRRARPQMPVEDAPAEALHAAEGPRAVEARLQLADVRRIANALPDEQRAVLMLVCVEELSYREAAGMLDIPIGTVMSRLARARLAIAQALDGGTEARDAAGGR